jgi:hypothetical protein
VGWMAYHCLGRQTEQNIYINIHCGLKQPPINISNATTNQKHMGLTEEKKARRFD